MIDRWVRAGVAIAVLGTSAGSALAQSPAPLRLGSRSPVDVRALAPSPESPAAPSSAPKALTREARIDQALAHRATGAFRPAGESPLPLAENTGRH